jgi:hypothetical protein
MRVFALGIEHPLDATVQRLHDPDPRQHRITAAAAQHQDLDRCLPFRQVGFVLRQLRDAVGIVLQRHELSAARQRTERFVTSGVRAVPETRPNMS